MNDKNLKHFTSENQPENRGRTPGKRNRSTIVREFLAKVVDLGNYNKKNAKTLQKLGFSSNDETEAILTAVQVIKAMGGDTAAYKVLMDSAHGAPRQEVDNNVTMKGKPSWLSIASEKPVNNGAKP